MSRLESELRRLEEGGFSILIERQGEVLFTSREPMLRPLLAALEALGEQLRGATVVDRIVGKAAAFLCVYAGVAEVYTPLASQPAVGLLASHGIPLEARRVVPFIRNREGNGLCPMEQLALQYETPEDFLRALGELRKGVS
ncbi:MAG: DUF1893 domain-containing protein [candidate division KSB1 bacterium]|nr:DUF1893 domain-containing protein [candidate division KSB1 bacterium]